MHEVEAIVVPDQAARGIDVGDERLDLVRPLVAVEVAEPDDRPSMECPVERTVSIDRDIEVAPGRCSDGHRVDHGGRRGEDGGLVSVGNLQALEQGVLRVRPVRRGRDLLRPPDNQLADAPPAAAVVPEKRRPNVANPLYVKLMRRATRLDVSGRIRERPPDLCIARTFDLVAISDVGRFPGDLDAGQSLRTTEVDLKPLAWLGIRRTPSRIIAPINRLRSEVPLPRLLGRSGRGLPLREVLADGHGRLRLEHRRFEPAAGPEDPRVRRSRYSGAETVSL